MDQETLEKIKILNQVSIMMTENIVKLVKIKKILEKRQRSCHVRYINRTRNLHGFYKTTFLEMKYHDPGQFFKYTRMNVDMFNSLLSLIKPAMEENCRMTAGFLTTECKLSITLLYLSQGIAIQKLAGSFKLGKETVRSIILKTIHMLWKTLYKLYVSEPKTNDYKQIEMEFRTMWNMPNCIGAIDGKHIALQCPPNAGSQFFNYKKFHSIVLLAACDAKYRFTHIDIGAYGSQNDSGIFQNSVFGKRIISGDGNIPPNKPLPGTNVVLPHFFVGDAAFPLGKNLMRPYAGKCLPAEKEYFNKRLSRARRTIENAFGILVARWRILLQTINMHPSNAEKVVLSCVLLHNFIMLNNDNGVTDYISSNYVDREDSNGELVEGLWRSEVRDTLPQIRGSNHDNHYGDHCSTVIRDKLKEYIFHN